MNTVSTQVMEGGSGTALQNQDSKEARLSKVALLLRGSGAIILIASAAAFLFQHWGEQDHLLRYIYFLAFTLVLGGAGFFCGIRMREDKGARTFLAVLAAIVPAHFCQLGGMIYSITDFTAHTRSYPSFAYYSVASAGEAGIAIALGLPVLALFTFVAFSALIRAKARDATAMYMTVSSLLLIPLRTGNAIALLSFCSFVLAVTFNTMLRRDSSLKTREGSMVRAMLATPVLIILFRSYMLYADQVTLLLISSNAAILAAVLFGALKGTAYKEACSVLQWLSLIPGAVSWGCLSHFISRNLGLDAGQTFALATLPYPVFVFAASEYFEEGKSILRILATLTLLTAASLELQLFGGIFASFLCIVIAVPVFCYGYFIKDQVVFFGGLGLLGMGLIYQLKYAVDIYTLSPWLSLASTGIVVIIASSYIERNYREIAARLKALKEHFNQEAGTLSAKSAD